MRDSLLRVILSEAGYKPLGLVCMAIALLVVWGRKCIWSEFVWLPLFAISGWFSFPAIFGLIAGGYGVLATIALWPFPVTVFILILGRPKAGVFGGRAIPGHRGAIGVLVLVMTVVVLRFIPRPGGINIRLQFVDSSVGGRPIVDTAFPVFIHSTLGGNFDEILHTDKAGFATLRLYDYDSGSIALRDLKDPRRNKSVHFESWPPRAGVPPGCRFDGKESVAGNSNEVQTIVWSGQRDMAARKTEPMHVFSPYVHLSEMVSTHHLDIESGKFGDTGDLTFRVVIGSTGGVYGPDCKLTISAEGNSGFLPSDEQFMDVAPETGYQMQTESVVLGTDQKALGQIPFKLYVKTRSGKYAVVAGEVKAYSMAGPEYGMLHVGIRYNPSGSRLVEFDHTKWLNR